MIACQEQLLQERDKLNKMVEEALNNGMSISEDKDIQEQCRLVERLINDAADSVD